MNFNYFIETEGLFTNSFKSETMKAEIGLFHFNSVLIIDNDDTDLFITSRMFMIKNVAKEILTQKSTSAAIELIKKLKTPPELIVIDFISKDGKLKEFLTALDKLPPYLTKGSKIIILSALLDYYENEVQEALEFQSVIKAIYKPIDDESLQTILNLETTLNMALQK